MGGLSEAACAEGQSNEDERGDHKGLRHRQKPDLSPPHAPAPAQTHAISAGGRTSKPRNRAGEGEAGVAQWESTVTRGSG